MRAERRGRVARVRSVVNRPGGGAGERTEAEVKPFDISKRLVWEAYQKVKANKGAAGRGRQSIDEFEQDLKRTTCTSCGIGCRRGVISRRRCGRWRYRKHGAGSGSSGCPPWRTGSPRPWRRCCLEPEVEPIFHPD